MTTIFTDTTVTSDQFVASGTAYTFGANNLNLTIDPGVAVVSQSNVASAVLSGLTGSRLANSGNIVAASQTEAAVDFSGNNGRIENNSSGSIIGATAIRVNGATEDVINYGKISGYAGFGVFLDSSASAVAVYNIGEIYGRLAGISSTAPGQNGFENYGTVRSDGDGIRANAGTLTILNEGSVLTNTNAIFTVGTGSVSLTNKGTLRGDVNCTSADGNDGIINFGGVIEGAVNLGGGNDTFNGFGGNVMGAIRGGSGNDTLIGGRGGDELWGEGDSDVFKFVNVKETGKAGSRDTIMDFSDVEGDLIDLINIDAKKGPGNQDFKFIGAQKFHDKAGELHVLNKGTFFLIEGDINGDGRADFQIQVTSNAPLEKGDFLGVL
jgi:Ca2+-binding RTX toxin-like protein